MEHEMETGVIWWLYGIGVQEISGVRIIVRTMACRFLLARARLHGNPYIRLEAVPAPAAGGPTEMTADKRSCYSHRVTGNNKNGP